MLSITREWVLKAETDYDVVLLLLRSRKRHRYDPTCFHAQQCVEKYLKGRLTEAGIAFAKTHDLEGLLSLALAIEPRWSGFAASFKSLTNHAVRPRYPGMLATAPEARTAVATCRKFRKTARQSLGLK
jgi:HEPN domain-containing protein